MGDNAKTTEDILKMSEEEVTAFLDDAEGEKPEPAEPEKEPDPVVEEPEVDEKTPEGETEEETTVEDEIKNPFYKDKSKSDLVAMIEENTKYSSRQNNEIHKLKTRLDDVTKDSTKAEVDESLKDYDEKSIVAIKKIVKRELEQDRINIAKLSQAELSKNKYENELVWDSVKELNPTTSKELQEKLVKEIQVKGSDVTLGKKGWVKEFVVNSRKKTDPSTKDSRNENLIKKKMKASTIGSGGAVTTSSNWKGKPEPKDPVEYISWLKDNKGFSI